MAPICSSCSPWRELEPTVTRVVEHYTRRLTNLLRLTPDDLADARQDLYVAVFNALPHYDAARGACLPTFLDRVLQHASTDIQRRIFWERARRHTFPAEIDHQVILENHTASDLTGAMVDAVADIDQNHAEVVASAAIDFSLALDTFQQTLSLELLVIFRGLMAGLNGVEIAQQLGVNESLVRYRIKKLRKAFRAFGLWTPPASHASPLES